jgi:TPR repeat protein
VKARGLLVKAMHGGATAAVVRWLEKAAADGDPEAMHAFARYHAEGWAVPRNPARAVEWFTKAAEAGHVNSMTALAAHYRDGRSIPVNRALTDEWLKKAADAGLSANAVHMFNLMQEPRVNADTAEALLLLEKAAEAGDVEAMASLAWAYAEGRGVARNYARAREWSEKAAALGHMFSMVMVSRAYDFGCGVAQGEAEARRWYEKARAGSDPRARNTAEQGLALFDRPDIRTVRASQFRARGCAPSGPPSSDSQPQ